jgi:glutathione synthase/RimK-type ligase-like ATP-grasp enzyme
MKIAIHHSIHSFSKNWIDYCEDNKIDYKIVDCYQSNIINQLSDCDALMFHHYHASSKDTLFAKQLLFALESAGKIVFPDFRTGWHFDDKVGQKYLFEAIGAPLVKSYVFYTKKDAYDWAEQTTFPKVFKLRGGSSGANVRLAPNRKKTKILINKAFGRGYSNYNAWGILKDRYAHFRKGKESFLGLMKGIGHIFIPTPFARLVGREKGYVYFQDFIPDNTHDIRITYVANRIFALRRGVRKGDFRASGSGIQVHDLSKIPIEAVKIGFEISQKLGFQAAAYDFILDKGKPVIVEVSYGFGCDPQQFDFGYWDEQLNWHPGKFNPYGWMVEDVLERIRNANTKVVIKA